MPPFHRIEDLPSLVGQTVSTRGWVMTTRSSGKIGFVTLRDGTGYLQVVLSKKDMPETAWEAVGQLTQETSVELAERPAWMSLSEAETTWMSRIDMNMPNTMIRNATSRRGAMRSDGAEAVIPGVAVVASAMRETYCGWTMTGESRSASLSASLAPSLVSTVA